MSSIIAYLIFPSIFKTRSMPFFSKPFLLLLFNFPTHSTSLIKKTVTLNERHYSFPKVFSRFSWVLKKIIDADSAGGSFQKFGLEIHRKKTEKLSRMKVTSGCPTFFKKRLWSDYIVEANPYSSLTDANPLLTHTGTLGCWVSPLALCVPL
jgi:hypothetical protein